MPRYIVAIPFITADGQVDTRLSSVEESSPRKAAEKTWGDIHPNSHIGMQLNEVITRVVEAKAGRLGEKYFHFVKPTPQKIVP